MAGIFSGNICENFCEKLRKFGKGERKKIVRKENSIFFGKKRHAERKSTKLKKTFPQLR